MKYFQDIFRTFLTKIPVKIPNEKWSAFPKIHLKFHFNKWFSSICLQTFLRLKCFPNLGKSKSYLKHSPNPISQIHPMAWAELFPIRENEKWMYQEQINIEKICCQRSVINTNYSRISFLQKRYEEYFRCCCLLFSHERLVRGKIVYIFYASTIFSSWKR